MDNYEDQIDKMTIRKEEKKKMTGECVLSVVIRDTCIESAVTWIGQLNHNSAFNNHPMADSTWTTQGTRHSLNSPH